MDQRVRWVLRSEPTSELTNRHHSGKGRQGARFQGGR